MVDVVQTIKDNIELLTDKIEEILPGIILFIVLLVIGWIISKLIANIVRKLLEKMGLEKAMDKVGVSEQFKSIGFKGVSHFMSIFVFWFIFLIFLQIGLGALEIAIISDILSPIVLFVPKALIAALLIVIGLWVGSLVASMLEKMLNKSGMKPKLEPVDKQIKSTGYSTFKFIALIVKIWIILIFVQMALDILEIAALNELLNEILLYFPRAVMAFFVIIIGLVVSDYVKDAIENWLKKTPMGSNLMKADKSTEKSGFSIISIALIFIKIWILLFFLTAAMDILAIDALNEILNPIILFFPKLIVAVIILVIGLFITEIIIKMVHKLFDEMEAEKFITPAEEILNKPGIIMRFIDFLLKVTVMLIFINMAVAVLEVTIIADLVSEVVLWIPNVFAAAIIVLIGLWFAGWLSEHVKSMSEENDLPFPSMLASATKILVIYVVLTMAMDQIGIEVPILYMAFGIVLGAVMIGLAIGFAFGFKDVSANIGGYLQVNKILKVGDRIKVGEYSGEVTDVNRYTIIIKDGSQEHVIPNVYIVKNTVTKL